MVTAAACGGGGNHAVNWGQSFYATPYIGWGSIILMTPSPFEKVNLQMQT